MPEPPIAKLTKEVNELKEEILLLESASTTKQAAEE